MDKKIHAPPSVKYLGLTIDQYVSGDEMARVIIKKVNFSLKLLYRQANFLDQRIKKIQCSALVLRLFNYSISSWYGGVLAQMIKSLQIAQNKVTRFILGKDARYHITDYDYKALNFLNIHNRAKQLRFLMNMVLNISGHNFFTKFQTCINTVLDTVCKISKFPSLPPLFQAHFIIMPFGIGTVYLVKQNQLQTNNNSRKL